eukprot:4120820-Pyramimonas_sp.AAC.1
MALFESLPRLQWSLACPPCPPVRCDTPTPLLACAYLPAPSCRHSRRHPFCESGELRLYPVCIARV